MTTKELVDFCMPRIPCDICPYIKECRAYYDKFKCFPFDFVYPYEAYSDAEIELRKEV